MSLIEEREMEGEPSCVSMKSHISMNQPPNLSDGDVTSDPVTASKMSFIEEREKECEPSCVSMKSHISMNQPPNLSDGDVTSDPVRTRQTADLQTSTLLEETADLQRVKDRHKTIMKNKYESLFEGIKLQENQTLLNRIYTQLYIIEGEREGVNEEHEVLHMEKKPTTQHSQDTQIYCNDIFKPLQEPGYKTAKRRRKSKIKSVLTKGIAGIGKTVSVQKFILDWAEGTANQDVDFMFVLPFRELNLIKADQYSLHKLLLDFHPELQDLDSKIYDECKVVIIFDGLDESRITLKFKDSEKVSEATQTSSVGVLISNLIKGDLLPSAHIWITSRPAAANQIPSEYINRLTEIQGFNDSQKEEYFRKRIGDEDQASRIISHIRRARSLHIMCHIPVFCWISSTVLQKILTQDHTAEIPQTLTEMYIHFLLIQINMKNEKYDERDPEKLLQSNREVIVKLSELAFKQLMKGNVMFYEEDLRDCGIDITDASVYSGICTEIFKEESVIHQRKIYCFIHLSLQEFLAAFFVLYTHINNVKPIYKGSLWYTTENSLIQLLISQVDTSLQVINGHLDLFLRFLLGISLDSNQRLLQDLLTHTVNSTEAIKGTTEYIKNKIKRDSHFDRSDNLLKIKNNQRLLDLQRIASIKKIKENIKNKIKNQNLLKSEYNQRLLGLRTQIENSHFDGSNNVFEKDQRDLSIDRSIHLPIKYQLPFPTNRSINLFDYQHYLLFDRLLNQYQLSLPTDRSINLFLCLLEMNDQTLYREILEFLKSNKHSQNKLSPAHCSVIAYMLQMSEEVLDEFDLSQFNTSDEGRMRLIPAVMNCRKAIFVGCNLSDKCCEILASVLLSSNSLRDLDLSYNNLQDSGVKLISDGLKRSNCQLNILRLVGCDLTYDCCERLGSVLQSSNSLRDLDLSNNNLQDSGVKLITDGLKSSKGQLNILRLVGCNLTDGCCKSLASVLQSSNSLRDLDLSYNDLQDSGVKLISDGLKKSHCQLNILRLVGCNLTDGCCESLASVLQSSNSLRDLDLSNNNLQDPGVKLISDGLKSSHCQLNILRFVGCNLTDKCCESLASVLQSSNSLRDLDLSNNDLQDSGVKLISDGLKSSNCQLNILRLVGCNLSDECYKSLASVLQSSNSLRDLDLSNNDLQDSRVKLISDGLNRSHCLNILRFVGCNLTDGCCEGLASVLQSSNSLRDLDLSYNNLQDSGVKLISDGLKSSHCQLNKLRLVGCNLTDGCCESLGSVLQSSHSLRDLDLSNNDLLDSGLKLICDGLKRSHCQLNILRLVSCNLTDGCCESLASVLQSSNSLRDLDLSNNDLLDSGLKLICEGLKSSHCQINILRLVGCNLTDGCCEGLASILQSPNSLRDLDLSNNDLLDLGVKLISNGLKSSHCQLNILRLVGCNLTDGCCESLASVLQSSNSLRDLDLSNNDLLDSGVMLISDGLKSSHCQLNILRLSGCMVTDEGCHYLASALSSNPSHLRELDLNYNHPGPSGVQMLTDKLNDPNSTLNKLNVDHGGKFRIIKGQQKYVCDLTLDSNTVNNHLILSEENRRVTHVWEDQAYPDNEERFDHYPQVLCKESLTGRCYWEVKFTENVDISVSYKGIKRKGMGKEYWFGYNEKSWKLHCANNTFAASHNNIISVISAVSPDSNTVGVYLDWSAGVLSFYSISDTHKLTHLHTYRTTFTEPLYAGFGVYSLNLLSLCPTD
ncbi:NACHT, LRR and PYD domains-containing protein 12-like isoform X2 [Misgurnus anguillicaudatus]|uniref:NACHT, LRR and PYD domains-containing protein 12-like isoform X2 n=1 Tax=Misgurnus anguillicaudatus TaxID=75329 RepID=UPI003CCF2493